MSTSVRTCTPTLSCPEVPPCTLVLPTECRRKSLPWLHPPLRSRSLLHLSVNTLSGSVDPSWLLCPPSNRCGSQSKNTTSQAQALSTGNASKYFNNYCSTTSLIIILLSNYYCNTTPPQHLSTSRANKPSEIIKYPSSKHYDRVPFNGIQLKPLSETKTNSKSSDGRARRAISIINRFIINYYQQTQQQQYHKHDFHHEHNSLLIIINYNNFILFLCSAIISYSTRMW